MSTLTRDQRIARNTARHRTITSAGARSATAAMIDTALEGGRLARSDGGEADQLRDGGALDPNGRTGRRLRLTGWVVGPDAPEALTADQVHALMVAAGLVPGGATIDTAVEEYVRLAVVADAETSRAADTAAAAAEAAHWLEAEAEHAAAQAARDQVRAALASWLLRIVHPPKWEYAAALVDAWENGTPPPADPAPDSWGPKTRDRFAWIVAKNGGAR